LGVSPIPNHNIKSGIKLIGGTCLKNSNKPVNQKLIFWFKPLTTESIKASKKENTKPSKTRTKLFKRCFTNSPDLHIEIKALKTFDGDGKTKEEKILSFDRTLQTRKSKRKTEKDFSILKRCTLFFIKI
jgi:hypothetical protein